VLPLGIADRMQWPLITAFVTLSLFLLSDLVTFLPEGVVLRFRNCEWTYKSQKYYNSTEEGNKLGLSCAKLRIS
jgi:hypothetical protein